MRKKITRRRKPKEIPVALPTPPVEIEYFAEHKLSGYPGTMLTVRSVSAPDPNVFEHLPLLQLIEFLRTHGWLTQERYFGAKR